MNEVFNFEVLDVTSSSTTLNPPVTTQILQVGPFTRGEVLEIGVPVFATGGVRTYTQNLLSSQLINGGVTITHALNKYVTSVVIWMNGGEFIQPDSYINLDLNNLFIELSSFEDNSNSFIIVIT
jgi:hypothetical protein